MEDAGGAIVKRRVEVRREYIGVYQRPAPPKRPLGLHRPGVVQQPQIPLHAIEAQANAMVASDGVRNLFCGGKPKRKRGRPSVNDDRPMTAAERQARRRDLQARERGIQEALAIGDAQGKDHAEARTGGYDSTKLDLIYAHRSAERLDREGDSDVHTGRQVRPGGASSADEQSTGELLNSGECSLHRGGFDEPEVEGVSVKGLRFGTEETNRRLFAEAQLKAMVEAHFDCAVNEAPSNPGITTYAGNNPLKHCGHVGMTFTCRLCGDSTGSIEDATDHLRVDHRQAIDEWFKRLNPTRYFRDMGRYVTITVPVKGEQSLYSAGCERSNVTQPGKMLMPRV